MAQPISNRAACATSTDAEVEEILCDEGRITGVAVRQQGKRTVVRGDHYVAALPLERIAPLVNGRLLGRRPDARQSARAGPERGVDERRAVLSAPRPADWRTGT